MESPTASTLISSTTLSLLGVTATSPNPLSTLILGQPTPATSNSPTKHTGLASVMKPAEVRYAEEPLHALIDKSPDQMTQAEIQRHVEMLRTLRKSPQSLLAKVRKDEEALDLQLGEPEHKKIRKAASKTVEEKTKRPGQSAEAQGLKLAGKFAFLMPTNTPPASNQPPA